MENSVSSLISIFLPYIKIMHGNGAEGNKMRETCCHRNMLINWLFHMELLKAFKLLTVYRPEFHNYGSLDIKIIYSSLLLSAILLLMASVVYGQL